MVYGNETFSSLAAGLSEIPATSMLPHNHACVVLCVIKHQNEEHLSFKHSDLDMPRIPGGWSIFAKEKCSLTLIFNGYMLNIGVKRNEYIFFLSIK